ncbi:MAG: 6-phosphofructokinase [Myxococcota bacterium]
MRIGVMTSGGDAQGMNAAVRGVVRRALAAGLEVVAVYEGYAGLVAGRMGPCTSTTVSRILHLGGTHFGTARCPEFRTTEGRRTAVANLVDAGIHHLAIIGGDGSLTGAMVLRTEWTDHLQALVAEGRLTAEQAEGHPSLAIVGMVGSIDNDLWGTDRTIGCDSALHRIVHAIDTLTATARSHQRSFVVEVMGRHCGFLALAAAVCTGADHLLIPEAPSDDWKRDVVAAVRRGRAQGKRKAIVIVAEGACDKDGVDIEAADVRKVLEAELDAETRVTVLGHVQRGGAPSAYDRITSSMLGARGAETLIGMTGADEPMVMTTQGLAIEPRPLAECLRQTQALAAALKERNYTAAVEARGPEFGELLSLHHRLTKAPDEAPQGPRILLTHVGAPAPGMNPAIRAFVRLARGRGAVPLLVQDGLRGLATNQIHEATWNEVSGIASLGATVLGTRRAPADSAVLAALDEHAIHGAVIVGGFEALPTAAAIAATGRPVAVVPATISNNVPGTDSSVGCDTALNVIVDAVDRLKQSAVGSRDRVFVVEVMGRRCGYLAVAGGLGAGAEIVYQHKPGITLSGLKEDVTKLAEAYDRGRQVGIVLMADGASEAFSANTLARVFQSESGGRFDTRVCVLGHLQQGDRPSPADRLLATRLVDRAVHHAADGEGAVVVGVERGLVIQASVASRIEEADLSHRRRKTPVHSDWDEVATLLRG